MSRERSTHTPSPLRATRTRTAIAALLFAPGLSFAQTQVVERSYSAGNADRQIAVFDFDEQDTNVLPVPSGWFRAQDDPGVPRDRPGYPIYNAASLDYESPARSGNGTLRLETKGGSTSLRLETGVLSVFPGADYRIKGYVRSAGLDAASFQLRARFLDQRGQPVEGSEQVAPLVQPVEEWSPVEITLLGLSDDAAYLQIELELLQPREYEAAILGEHHVWEDDLSGAFFVDDLIVTQLPRVEMRTTSPGNVLMETDPTELLLLVRDLTAEQLSARVVVYGSDGTIVYESERPIFGGAAPIRIRPELPEFGWYRAEATIMGRSGPVSGTFCDLVYLPTPRETQDVVSCRTRPDDRRRFGLLLDAVRPGMIELLPEMLTRTQVGALSLGVWGNERQEETVRALAGTYDELASGWQEVTLGLDALPADPVFAARRQDELLPMLADSSERSPLDPWVVPMIDQFGQSVSRWRIGSIADPSAFFEPSLSAMVERASDRLSSLVPGPELILPWRAEYDPSEVLGAEGLGALSVVFDGGTGDEAVRSFGEQWQLARSGESQQALTTDEIELSYVLRPADPMLFGYRAGASELVRRAVAYWSVHAQAEGDPGGCPSEFLMLADAWNWSGGRRPQPMPTPELAALRTAIDHLTDRRLVGELRVANGVRCFVLAPADHAPPERGGALVAWAEEARGAQIRQFLGDGNVRVIDIFNNASEPIETTPWNDDAGASSSVEIHRIDVGSEPIFIEGIDVDLARFIASFKLTPDFLESGYEAHDASIAFANPWSGGITGTASIVSPGGGVGSERDRSWTFSPRVSRFAAEAGAKSEMPLNVSFSPVEEAGLRDLVLDIDLIAPGLQRRLRVVTAFEIGLEGIELDVKYFPIAGTSDAVLEAILTNTGTEERSLQLIANVPGYPRLRAAADDLGPGVSVSRRFRLEGAADRIRGDQAFVGAIDRARGARLNKVVQTR